MIARMVHYITYSKILFMYQDPANENNHNDLFTYYTYSTRIMNFYQLAIKLCSFYHFRFIEKLIKGQVQSCTFSQQQLSLVDKKFEMAQFAGKYTFVSQDNFDEWLKAAGM